VGAVGSAKGVVDVYITEARERGAELVDGLLGGLNLVALSIDAGTLLLRVETNVLEQEDLAVLASVHGSLNGIADAVIQEGDGPKKTRRSENDHERALGEDELLEELLELLGDRLERLLGVAETVGTTEVGHERHGLGT